MVSFCTDILVKVGIKSFYTPVICRCSNSSLKFFVYLLIGMVVGPFYVTDDEKPQINDP